MKIKNSKLKKLMLLMAMIQKFKNLILKTLMLMKTKSSELKKLMLLKTKNLKFKNQVLKKLIWTIIRTKTAKLRELNRFHWIHLKYWTSKLNQIIIKQSQSFSIPIKNYPSHFQITSHLHPQSIPKNTAQKKNCNHQTKKKPHKHLAQFNSNSKQTSHSLSTLNHLHFRL